MTLDMTGGAGLYSLPRTEDGVVKVAYRGTKYTNYATTAEGKRISVPKTANVTEEKETNIPLQALDAIKCNLEHPLYHPLQIPHPICLLLELTAHSQLTYPQTSPN